MFCVNRRSRPQGTPGHTDGTVSSQASLVVGPELSPRLSVCSTYRGGRSGGGREPTAWPSSRPEHVLPRGLGGLPLPRLLLNKSVCPGVSGSGPRDAPFWGRLDVRPMGSRNKDNDHFDDFIQPK